jgi:hypothetical protein
LLKQANHSYVSGYQLGYKFRYPVFKGGRAKPIHQASSDVMPLILVLHDERHLGGVGSKPAVPRDAHNATARTSCGNECDVVMAVKLGKSMGERLAQLKLGTMETKSSRLH